MLKHSGLAGMAALLALAGGACDDADGQRAAAIAAKEVPYDERPCPTPAPETLMRLTDRRLLCIGGVLLAVPRGVSFGLGKHEVEPSMANAAPGVIHQGRRISWNLRQRTTAPAEGEPTFEAIFIFARPLDAEVSASDLNWRDAEPRFQRLCFPERYEASGSSPLDLCRDGFRTDRLTVEYDWNARFLAPGERGKLDREVRRYLSEMIVTELERPPAAQVGP